MKFNLNTSIVITVLSLLAVSLPSYAQQQPYIVTDGNKLDAASYNGFKLYRNWCARCHGTYGQGMVGPNLADSLRVISKNEFFTTLAEGKTGSIGSMPAWKMNQKVMAGKENLYRYLKARSDGAIGEIKPKKAK
jgi:mono/diheme cytochrome c family protein